MRLATNTFRTISIKGSALFLILIAVALFAALTYAVTSAGRGSGSIDKEQARIEASRLMQYGSSIRDAISKVKVLKGYDPWFLDLSCASILTPAPTVYFFCAHNGAPTLCTEDSCKLFTDASWGSSNIGWVTPALPDTKAFLPDSSVTVGYARRQSMLWIRVIDIGTATPEIVLVFYGLKDEVCRQVNDLAGIGEIQLWDNYNIVGFGAWTSTSPATVTTNIVGDDQASIAGKTTFCLTRPGFSGGNTFHFVVAEL